MGFHWNPWEGTRSDQIGRCSSAGTAELSGARRCRDLVHPSLRADIDRLAETAGRELRGRKLPGRRCPGRFSPRRRHRFRRPAGRVSGHCSIVHQAAAGLRAVRTRRLQPAARNRLARPMLAEIKGYQRARMICTREGIVRAPGSPCQPRTGWVATCREECSNGRSIARRIVWIEG
jgi:hypothetical protein